MTAGKLVKRGTGLSGGSRDADLWDQFQVAVASRNSNQARIIHAEFTQEGRSQFFAGKLCLELQKACREGDITAVRFLIDHGAEITIAGKEGSALISAIKGGHEDIVALLLSPAMPQESMKLYEAQRIEAYRKGFETAVLYGNCNMVKQFLDISLDINGRDRCGRTVLMILCMQSHKALSEAAQQKKDLLQVEIVRMLLDRGIDIEARENGSSRTTLHWAAANGRTELLKILLSSDHGKPADVKAVAEGRKTVLHVAAEKNAPVATVEVLLDYGADIRAKKTGGWTPLHVAAGEGAAQVLQVLLKRGADPEAETDDNRSPLHCAADKGYVECVKILAPVSGRKIHEKDSKDRTPLMLANGHREITELLSLFKGYGNPSSSVEEACRLYNAWITDIQPRRKSARNDIVLSKRPVYELLYEQSTVTPKWKNGPGPSQDPKFQRSFRWIHLPANNMSWAEVLLTRYHMEHGHKEADAYRNVVDMLNSQRQGHATVHSREMKPSCQRTLHGMPQDGLISGFRSGKPIDNWEVPFNPSEEASSNVQNELPSLRDSNQQSQVLGDKSPSELNREQDISLENPRKVLDLPLRHQKDPVNQVLSPVRRTRSGLVRNSEKGSIRKARSGRGMLTKVNTTNGHDAPTATHSDFGRISLFMPYLHYEVYEKSQEMTNILDQVYERRRRASMWSKHISQDQLQIEKAMRRDPLLKTPTFEKSDHQEKESLARQRRSLNRRRPDLPIVDSPETSRDVKLVRAYLLHPSPLHPRRTLDQYYYPTSDTHSRDQDQVVYRYATKHPKEIHEPKIFMVDQLWMWILDKDLIITSFPQKWQQQGHSDDPFDIVSQVSQALKEDQVSSVYELASCITNNCSGLFYNNRHREEYRFLDLFEQSIADLEDEEPKLSAEFKEAAEGAEKWISDDSKRFKTPKFDDYFTQVGNEMKLLAEAKDIQNEIDMVMHVLREQERLLTQLRDNIRSEFLTLKKLRKKATLEVTFDAQIENIKGIIERLVRMKQQAGEFYDSCNQLLDLKQKYAGLFEARYSRIQATASVRQGHTVMVFTIVTVLFLPLSFIAAFFAIPVDEFKAELPLGYTSKMIFAIGLAIAVPLVVVALTVDNITRWWNRERMLFSGSRAKGANFEQSDTVAPSLTGLHDPNDISQQHTGSGLASQLATAKHRFARLNRTNSRPPRIEPFEANVDENHDVEKGKR